MKKIIAAAAFIFAVGFAQAQTDSSQSASSNSARTQYEYYPDANVYYNDAAKTYWYYDSTSTKWQNAAELPSTYSVDDKTTKNTFYYNGGNVWEKNADHVKMYGKKSKPKKSGN